MDKVPCEILALIIQSTQEFHLQHLSPCVGHALELKTYRELKSLRLVCRAFCQCASPLLFQKVSVGNEWGFEARLNRLRELRSLAASEHALSLRELVVTVPPRRSQNLEVFIAELGNTLPSCLTAFQALEALQLDFGPFSNWVDTNRELPENLRDKLAICFLSMFRHTSLPDLRELNLGLTCTHDFGQLLRLDEQAGAFQSSTSLKLMLGNLRHLIISISDNSGSDRQRHYRTPYSEAQTTYPNQKHVRELFQFVEVAQSLESLQIKGTHVLDVDLLSTLRFHNLRFLDLSRVKTRADCLSQLIYKHRRTLSSVWLTLVELQGGNWEEVFLQLMDVEQLNSFHTDSIGYVWDGESANFTPCLVPRLEDPQEIESYRFRDKCALGDLLRRVNAKRITTGLEVLDKHRSLTAPPVEVAISQGF